MKNKYDSAVIFLYAIGKEAMLPYEFRKQIPYSTISTWRSTDYSKYLGHEFRYFFDEAFSSIEVTYRYAKMKKLVSGLTRAWVTLSHLLVPIIKNSCEEKNNRIFILRAINFLREHIGLEQSLKLTVVPAGIEPATQGFSILCSTIHNLTIFPLFLNANLRCTEVRRANVKWQTADGIFYYSST
jgi:hypothetical protein